MPKKKIGEDKGYRLTARQKQLQLGAKRKRKDADPENPEGQVHATNGFNEKGSMDTDALKSHYGAYHGMMGVQNCNLLRRCIIL